MDRPLYKFLLTAHVATSVSWVGVEVVFLAFAIEGLLTSDSAHLRAAYLSAGLLATVCYAPVSLSALITGVLLGLRTKWGLLRYYWVLVKLVMTSALVLGGNLIVMAGIRAAARTAAVVPADALDGALRQVRFFFVGAVSVGVVLLLTATVLSIYKPWGRTPLGRR
jgi:hypothetical protein